MKNNLKAPADAMYPLRRSRPYLPNWALNCVPVASVSVLRVVKNPLSSMPMAAL